MFSCGAAAAGDERFRPVRLLGLVLVVAALLAAALLQRTIEPSSSSGVLLVPAQHLTIQDAVDAATDGDTVLVSPGTYGSVVIDGKDITLASRYHTTGDDGDIATTVIDGGGSGRAVLLRDTTDATRIIGFTIQNADDGVLTRNARFQFLNNRVTDTQDGIDYESSGGGRSGGLVRDSVFEDNSDDGIDLDNSVDVIIEDSILRNNGNDGIEIRLHGNSAPTLDVVIRRNAIHGNDGDGIQLIGYPDASDRNFVIERNLIYDNGQAGIGLMDDAETDEDYRGAPLPDPILVRNNTFDNNTWAFTGGANTTFVNNAVLNSSVGGVKNLTGSSLASYSGFWQNGADLENVTTGAGLVFQAPAMSPNFTLMAGSPYINAGDPTCMASGTVCDIGRFEYGGYIGVVAASTNHVDVSGFAAGADMVTVSYVDPDGGPTCPSFTTQNGGETPSCDIQTGWEAVATDGVTAASVEILDVRLIGFDANADTVTVYVRDPDGSLTFGCSGTVIVSVAGASRPVTKPGVSTVDVGSPGGCSGDFDDLVADLVLGAEARLSAADDDGDDTIDVRPAEVPFECSTEPTPFTDVSATSFAYGDIGCLYWMGVTTGTSATTFSPLDLITREQMAAFLARVFRSCCADLDVPDHPFTDVPDSSFADGDIALIFDLGVTTGTSRTTFSPYDYVSREQAAAFLARLYSVAFGTPEAPVLGWVSDTPFTDLAPSAYSFADVGRIYGLGITTGTSATSYSPDDYLTREQMAAFLTRLIRVVNLVFEQA